MRLNKKGIIFMAAGIALICVLCAFMGNAGVLVRSDRSERNPETAAADNAIIDNNENDTDIADIANIANIADTENVDAAANAGIEYAGETVLPSAEHEETEINTETAGDEENNAEKMLSAEFAETENNGEQAEAAYESDNVPVLSKEEYARSVPPVAETPDEKTSLQEDISDKELVCTLSVRCDTILDNIDSLDSAKRGLIPPDGVIFAEREVVFYEGESVFNILLREMKKNKIHMEYESTPVYKSAYIEGINNIYQFDCGDLSGWVYRVNGSFPNYGCSGYELHEGDRVEWLYTCDLGADVGGGYAPMNGR